MYLRPINKYDVPRLRQWKNDHREAFIHKEEISEEQQDEWFRGYRSRLDDYMFMVIVDSIPIGCVAVRMEDEGWDVYNVILGFPEYGGRGLMSEALKAMLDFAFHIDFRPVTAKVLKNNPAVEWYMKNGFSITQQDKEFHVMTYGVSE